MRAKKAGGEERDCQHTVRGRNRGARAHPYLIGVHTRRCWERPSQALGRGKEEEDGNDSEGRRRVVAFAHA